jgi:3-methyladenine DNA glycosylase AlkD/RimJ/RimL family protein N-acetyltransferase
MYELAVADYARARAAFQGMDHHLAVQAILEGSVPARVFVDDPIRPRAAFTWRKHRFYLSGAADNKEFNGALGRFLSELIDLQWQADGSDLVVLYYAPEAWELQLAEMLSARFPIRVERQYYEFQALQNDWRSLLPEGSSVQLVDRSLLEQEHLANLGDLMKEMASERQSTEDFFGKSFGLCVLQGDELVGWCLSEYNTAHRCEVGIEVLKPYRKRGLGTAMTGALVEHALSEGVSRIGWHCYSGNVASGATASKAGFEKVQDYAVYLVRLEDQDEVDRAKAVAAEIDAEIRSLPVQNTPKVRTVRRRYSRVVKGWQPDSVLALARTLVESYGYRWVAYELIREHRRTFQHLGGTELEELGKGIDSWWAVDSFARTLSGPAWLEGLVADELIHNWARSEDRWWRRAALVSTVALNVRSHGGQGDVPRTLAVCRLLVDDRDDMVVKALSWALRALVVHDAEAVCNFVEEYEERLAARVKREVRNKLTTGLKNPR